MLDGVNGHQLQKADFNCCLKTGFFQEGFTSQGPVAVMIRLIICVIQDYIPYYRKLTLVLIKVLAINTT